MTKQHYRQHNKQHDKPYTKNPQNQVPSGNLFEAALIDDQGREIPITEGMILEACRKLESAASSVYADLFGSKRKHRYGA